MHPIYTAIVRLITICGTVILTDRTKLGIIFKELHKLQRLVYVYHWYNNDKPNGIPEVLLGLTCSPSSSADASKEGNL